MRSASWQGRSSVVLAARHEPGSRADAYGQAHMTDQPNPLTNLLGFLEMLEEARMLASLAPI